VRPLASLQNISPHDRFEPIGLAPRDATARHGKLQQDHRGNTPEIRPTAASTDDAFWPGMPPRCTIESDLIR
jgi:hypothetical protein